MAGASIERGIRSRRVVTPRGEGPACLLVGGGTIREIVGFDEAPAGLPLDDWGELALLPGLVDSHVHVNEPGRTAWEGFATATRAAAAGGVTTIVDMPLNAIPATTRRDALEAKRAAAAAAPLEADVAFWGGVVPGNIGELEPLASAGVAGFKAFLSPSGVEEFPAIGIGDLALAAAEVRRLEMALGRPLPILVHAEAPAVLAAAARVAAGPAGPAARRSSYAAWLESRPVAAETAAIEALMGIARSTGAAIHVVHVSSGAGAALLAEARREGLRLSGETCPHYLTFSAEAIADGATAWKCAPPIRDAGEREALWTALAGGSLALVASDHSPCPPELKRAEEGDFFAAWGGIASLELCLAATWTGAVARGAGLPDIAEWMAAAPARLAGLGGRKGRLAAGCDADCAVFDPEAAFRVDPGALHQRHPITPYAGRALVGRVRATYRRGVVGFRDGDFPGAPPGRILAIPPGGSGSGGHRSVASG